MIFVSIMLALCPDHLSLGQFQQRDEYSNVLGTAGHSSFPKVIPGRVSLLVTLFLSLTALLVSTISSSPEVTSHINNSVLTNLFRCHKDLQPWLFGFSSTFSSSSGQSSSMGSSSLSLGSQHQCLQEEVLSPGSMWRKTINLKKKRTPRSALGSLTRGCSSSSPPSTSCSTVSTGQYAWQPVTFKKISDKSSISYMLPNTLSVWL